jgi:hypothetical protein
MYNMVGYQDSSNFRQVTGKNVQLPSRVLILSLNKR